MVLPVTDLIPRLLLLCTDRSPIGKLERREPSSSLVKVESHSLKLIRKILLKLPEDHEPVPVGVDRRVPLTRAPASTRCYQFAKFC